jgi:hypothetical protein
LALGQCDEVSFAIVERNLDAQFIAGDITDAAFVEGLVRWSRKQWLRSACRCVPVRRDLRAGGNTPKALEWLEVAMRLRDPGLVHLKTDSLLDPLRREPRFQAIERALKFPTLRACSKQAFLGVATLCTSFGRVLPAPRTAQPQRQGLERRCLTGAPAENKAARSSPRLISPKQPVSTVGSTPEVLIDRRPSEKNYLCSCTMIIDPCPALRRKPAQQVLFTYHPRSAQCRRVWDDEIEPPTRGAFDRSSIRFNRLIELELATRSFTAFGVIYHTSIIRPRATI